MLSGSLLRLEVGGMLARRVQLLPIAQLMWAASHAANYQAEAQGYTNLSWTGVYEPHYQFTAVNADIEWAKQDPDPNRRIASRYAPRPAICLKQPPGKRCHIQLSFASRKLMRFNRSANESVRFCILDLESDWSRQRLAKIFRNLQHERVVPADAPDV